MALLLQMAVGIVAGMMMHYPRRYYIHMRASLVNLISYALGALSVLPLAMWTWSGLHEMAEPTTPGQIAEKERGLKIFAAAYLLAYLFFGAGVFIGYLVAPDEQ